MLSEDEQPIALEPLLEQPREVTEVGRACIPICVVPVNFLCVAAFIIVASAHMTQSQMQPHVLASRLSVSSRAARLMLRKAQTPAAMITTPINNAAAASPTQRDGNSDPTQTGHALRLFVPVESETDPGVESARHVELRARRRAALCARAGVTRRSDSPVAVPPDRKRLHPGAAVGRFGVSGACVEYAPPFRRFVPL